MNKQAQIVGVLVLSLSIIITGSMAGFQGIQISNLSGDVADLENHILDLQDQYQELESNHSNLQEQYDELLSNNSLLQDSYGDLNTSYSELIEDYLQLQLDYQDLSDDYADLVTDYYALVQSYTDLFNDYENLQAAFEDPLTDPVTPTIYQVLDWLDTDNTDQHSYVSDIWECGDFSAMLMTRAKQMNWRMRIAVVHYSFEGELSYGSMLSIYGTGGHALNLIECTDGLYYIEPQSDGCWYFYSGSPGNHVHMDIHTYYNFVGDEFGSVWDGYQWWTNFYGYFG
ncbi:MAG: hypothetical protein RTU30_07775 [Candidatus Thorarchaeota archaeon]